MGNWDELQRDLIVLVAERIGLLEDFRAFGGVCRSWRSAAVMENFKGCSRVPWLMLAEEEDEEKEEVEEQKEEEEKKNDVSRSFVWLTRGPGIIPGMIQKFSVPEAKGKRCVESLGWLVAISLSILYTLMIHQAPDGNRWTENVTPFPLFQGWIAWILRWNILKEKRNCQGGAAAILSRGEWVDNGSGWKWQRGRPTPKVSAGLSGIS